MSFYKWRLTNYSLIINNINGFELLLEQQRFLYGLK